MPKNLGGNGVFQLLPLLSTLVHQRLEMWFVLRHLGYFRKVPFFALQDALQDSLKTTLLVNFPEPFILADLAVWLTEQQVACGSSTNRVQRMTQ